MVTNMVTEGDQASGGEHTIKYTDGVLQSCTPEIYIMQLTNVTLINLIKNKYMGKYFNRQRTKE